MDTSPFYSADYLTTVKVRQLLFMHRTWLQRIENLRNETTVRCMQGLLSVNGSKIGAVVVVQNGSGVENLYFNSKSGRRSQWTDGRTDGGH